MKATDFLNAIESVLKTFSATQLGKQFAETKAVVVARTDNTLTIYKNGRSKPETMTLAENSVGAF
jgi:hypothetical protein